ncbi:MAG TPA: hypothetical protein D7H83_03520 [Candidatus Poseidoniales archaeon]|nr:MAG TPA: hypothetical protein D7H83_03520 [Candidatus Poseidoniales archaeon]|tara:strand:+ start:940 stop:5736 length:4797 start_codon:yes stop_codon:yes gene_type:complete
MALFLVLMFCAMSYLPMVNANPNRQVDVVIGLGPNGMSDQFTVEVPNGEIVTDFDVKVFEEPWPINDVVTLDDKSDWMNGDSMDGIDYNLSGLRILPMSHGWDFEGSVQGWTLDSSGGWAHGYDSTLGSVNGVHSGASAIYTYNGNYPNYMGGPYWATSPTIDCTSCSGTWDLKFWKRLGVESSSYDRAYVSVKTTSGGWTNVYSNPYGTTSDSSYNQVSYDISNYITGNSAFQVRFGLGTTDGSVTYTGWNVDDILIEPRGNTGSGSANWTSQAFGPGASGNLQMQHGLMAIDATIPQGAVMRWSLIDASDSSIIPGFLELEDLQADLSIIDFKKHPMVQLKIQMESVSESPIIHSIKLGGGIIESFTENPTTKGWSGFSSHSNGQVSGNGMLYSPEWRLTHPFSAIDMSWSASGNGNFEACFTESNSCSSGWTSIPSDGKLQMDHPSTTLNLRWSGSGSYSIDSIHIDLHRQSSPLDARIDVGLDGVSEWSFSNEMIGGWGLQDVFENGEKSVELSIASSGTDVTGLYYPIRTGLADPSYDSTNNMMLAFTAVGAPLDGVEVTFSVGGNDLITESLGFIYNSARLILSDSQMQDLKSEMDSRTAEINVIGELDAHKIEISVTSNSGGNLQISGLSIPYRYDAHIEGEDALPIIAAINSQLSQVSSSNGMKEVPIPVVMTNPGKLLIWDYGLQTLGSPHPTGITMSNQTDTLVAGNDWYEFNSSFDLSNIGISDASSQFASEGWASVFTLGGSEWSRSVHCSVVTGSCNSDQGIILGDFSYQFSNSEVEFFHRLQISSIWPDEEALIASSSIDMNGPASEPNQIRFGSGWSMGVEQDIDVIDWHLSFMNGAQSTWDALYFDPANPGIVEVELAFEDLEDTPRSSTYNVALYADGVVVDTTQSLSNGVATLMFTPNVLASKVDLQIEVSGLYGQDVNWKVPKNATFLIDDLAPVLISTNVAPLDHRSTDMPLELTFEIGDRPVLPRHSLLHVETSWNGEQTIMLDQPANLNGFQGIYSTIFDVSDAQLGDSMSGWLEVFDPAGHALPDSGSEENPLFIISFGPDGAPMILEDGLGWTHEDNWLHPGQNYSMQIPIRDVNGYGDIETVSVDLSSESSENLVIDWNSQSGCSSSTSSIIIQGCFIVGDSHHFEPFFTLEVVMSFGWDFNPDTSLERSIRITASDDSGQSHRSEIDASWRYSSEMEIDLNTAGFTQSSAFVAPGQSSILTADIVWTKGGQLVHTIVDVSASIDGIEQFGLSENGVVNMPLVAPNSTGIHPIKLDLINLPAGAIDRTDSEQVVAWMVVDGNQPKVLQLLSPDPLDLVQERDWQDLNFEIMVNETEGLNLDSLRMHWLIVPHGMAIPELALLGGNVSMELIAGTGAGTSIPLSATLDVDSIVPEVSRQNSWDLWVWVVGEDLAGQQIESVFNSRSSPLAILQLASRDADLRIESDDITIGSEYPQTSEPILINVTVHNDGQVDGLTSVRVEVIEDGDKRRLIEIVNIEVPASSSISFEAKWVPEHEGAAWIEISTPDGMFARTNPIQVESGDSTFVIESLDGASGPMLTGFAVITFVMIGLLGFLITSGRRPKDQDFDESEFI